MQKIILMRHAKTKGNQFKRYIGSTDEHLCEEGIILATQCRKRRTYPQPDLLYVSPMKRCLETAHLLFPQAEPHIVNELRETHFGDYENKSYEDLKDEKAYQTFLEYGGVTAFPNGESRGMVAERVLPAFDAIVTELVAHPVPTCTLLVHGGTIMTILEHYAHPKKDYYHWQVEPCGGYLVCVDETTWLTEKKLKVFKRFRGEF